MATYLFITTAGVWLNLAARVGRDFFRCREVALCVNWKSTADFPAMRLYYCVYQISEFLAVVRKFFFSEALIISEETVVRVQVQSDILFPIGFVKL
jgi:hypothetical protein